jgi:hypothetical protein
LDASRVARELTRLLYSLLEDPAKGGRLLVAVAEARGQRLGPLPAGQLRRALDRLGGGGYGLVGEAFLEHAGLSYLFRDRPGPGRRPGPASRLRGLLRSWLARHISVELGFEPAPGI